MNALDGFALPESIDHDDVVVATYLLRSKGRADIHKLAHGLAELQSTGTWVPLERETQAIRERHSGQVVAMWEVPDHEMASDVTDLRGWILQVAYPTHNIGAQIPLLLTTALGEAASTGPLKLVDLHLPKSFVQSFRGPKFGLDGVRKLVGASGRPLLVAVMKPAIGLTPKESGKVVHELALGGTDAVKDDELLVSQPWSQLLERVREHERAARAAYEKTGHRTLCFANITDRPDRLVTNAHRALEAGASGLMVDHITVGVSALSVLADDPEIQVPILGHLAFAGALYAAPWSGVSSHLILGKLPRLAGADLVVYPGPYGKLDFERSKHLRVAGALRSAFHGIRSALPVPGGGLHAGVVKDLIGDLGIDHGLGAGGAIHGHPMGPAAGARAIRQAMEAVTQGEPLETFAKGHPELAMALASWPESSAAPG